jgi:hypothetical protein
MAQKFVAIDGLGGSGIGAALCALPENEASNGENEKKNILESRVFALSFQLIKDRQYLKSRPWQVFIF